MTYQKIGSKTIGSYFVEAISMSPKYDISSSNSLANSSKDREIHKQLANYTHRIMFSIGHKKTADPISGLNVHVSFSHEKWTKRFKLTFTSETGQPAYAANVTLGLRGTYDVIVKIQANSLIGSQEISRLQKISKIHFSFDYPYEGIREVMASLKEKLGDIGQEVLTLGIDGNTISPEKMESLRRKAKFFRQLVPWIAQLRIGAAQEIFEEHVDRLFGEVKNLETTTIKDDLDGMTQQIISVRRTCIQSHQIFQEADSTGGPPEIPDSTKHK